MTAAGRMERIGNWSKSENISSVMQCASSQSQCKESPCCALPLQWTLQSNTKSLESRGLMGKGKLRVFWGNGGVPLSGKERSMCCIARTYLKDRVFRRLTGHLRTPKAVICARQKRVICARQKRSSAHATPFRYDPYKVGGGNHHGHPLLPRGTTL